MLGMVRLKIRSGGEEETAFRHGVYFRVHGLGHVATALDRHAASVASDQSLHSFDPAQCDVGAWQ